jgi:hypothetical protein
VHSDGGNQLVATAESMLPTALARMKLALDSKGAEDSRSKVETVSLARLKSIPMSLKITAATHLCSCGNPISRCSVPMCF